MKESILVQATIQCSGDGNHLPVVARNGSTYLYASLNAGTVVMNRPMPPFKVIEEYELPAEKIGFFTMENDGFNDLMLNNLISPPIRPTEDEMELPKTMIPSVFIISKPLGPYFPRNPQ
jgi:hypothetical protein